MTKYDKFYISLVWLVMVILALLMTACGDEDNKQVLSLPTSSTTNPSTSTMADIFSIFSSPIITDVASLNVANPSTPEDYTKRGTAFLIQKEYQKALDDFNKAIQLDPNYPYAYNGLGSSYVALKESQKALAAFDKCIELDPDYPLAYANRGSTYYQLKNYPKAIADFTKAIQLNPSIATFYILRGYVYLEQSDFQKAVNDFTKGLELDPKLAVLVYYNRSHAYAGLKEYQKAIDDLESYIKLNPSDAKGYFFLGGIYYELKDMQKARVYMEKAAQLGDPYAKDFVEYFNSTPTPTNG